MSPAAVTGLTPELCARVVAALRAHGGVMKIGGYAVTANDLERMAKGGAQDRADEVARLTANQVNVLQFATHLGEALAGISAKKFPPALPFEVGAQIVTTPTASAVAKTMQAIGAVARPAPAVAAGLKISHTGATFKHGFDHSGEAALAQIVRKSFTAHATALHQRPLPGGFFAGADLARVLCRLDAVIVQRVLRDTLRAAPETRALGMNALRLLSPLSDALEAAAVQHFFELLKGLAATHGAALATLAGESAVSAAGEIATSSETGAAHVPDAFIRASCAELHLPCEGLLAQIYRRVTVSGSLVAVLQRLASMISKIPAEQIPMKFAVNEATHEAAPSDWAPLSEEELGRLADHLFSVATPPHATLPTAGAPSRSPARTLLMLRGEQVLLTAWAELLTKALRDGVALPADERAQLAFAQSFFAGLDSEATRVLVHGLFQMAQGDSDQRARQVGRFILSEARSVFLPGATLGPVRVAFVKFWRAQQTSV